MFKFVFSCQPLYYYIHKVLKRCPTECYIKPVCIPGYCGKDDLRWLHIVFESRNAADLG